MCSGCTLGASWTALDMAGLSLSVLRLDDGRLQRLHAPTKVFIISSLLQLITIRQTWDSVDFHQRNSTLSALLSLSLSLLRLDDN